MPALGLMTVSSGTGRFELGRRLRHVLVLRPRQRLAVLLAQCTVGPATMALFENVRTSAVAALDEGRADR